MDAFMAAQALVWQSLLVLSRHWVDLFLQRVSWVRGLLLQFFYLTMKQSQKKLLWTIRKKIHNLL